MNKDLFIEKIIDLWCQDNDVESRKIEYSTYKSITPHFTSYDDWKLASPEDYYEETEHYEVIDMNSLIEYMTNELNDNYDINELLNEYGSEEEILLNMKSEFFSDLERWYLRFEDLESERLVEKYTLNEDY